MADIFMRILPETHSAVLARITRRAEAAIAHWTVDDLTNPRIDRDAVASAMQRWLAVRGHPSKPLHWFADGRSARAYMDARNARTQPLPAYWPEIRIAEPLDQVWFARTMLATLQPHYRIDMNRERALFDWKMWICVVTAFIHASAADPSRDIPPDLLPIQDGLPEPEGAGEPITEDELRGVLLKVPLAIAPQLPAVHPERLGAPLIEAFAAGLCFFSNGPNEVVCIPRPALWLSQGVLHRDDGPAVLWPSGEQYFFHLGQEVERS